MPAPPGGYFHNSTPAEADYFSPEWYVEVLPVAQIQRFHGGWRTARHFEASVTSPPISRDWHVRAAVLHSSAPVASGQGYDYTQASLSLSRAF